MDILFFAVYFKVQRRIFFKCKFENLLAAELVAVPLRQKGVITPPSQPKEMAVTQTGKSFSLE